MGHYAFDTYRSAFVWVSEIDSEKLNKVDLPVASRQEEKVTGVLISITEEHKVFVNEKLVTIIDVKDQDIYTDVEELTAELKNVLGEDISEKEGTYYVIIRADKSLPYREVQKALNSVLLPGISNVHFAVFEEQQG